MIRTKTWLPLAIAERSGPVQAQSAEEKGGAVKAPPADIRRYLKPTGLMEIRYIRMLASLCNETYYLSKLSVSISQALMCRCMVYVQCTGLSKQHA